MSELKSNIAKNLIALRTKAKLTQLQLAEMLNYSDKAVSKWERGEAVPDLRVLLRLSEIFGVSLDDIVKADSLEPRIQPKRRINGMRAFIVAMSTVLVWFVAMGVFMILYFITKTENYAWLTFVVALLPMAIVWMVFSAKWGNRAIQALSASAILWSVALVCHIFVITFTDFGKIYILYIVAAVFELLIILWFSYRWFANKIPRREKKRED
ncbi:MAG: helix-turn-helix transcriptional regulator [Clostridiales bacterium]|nr:helix-turn-helix transcriptional regulator [Clostridiales bacterium]